MNLIDAYVYEVTRRLPKKSRDDIALELRVSIEDTLPENYTDIEVKEVLAKLDDPATLAASYRDTPMYLIGPKVYDAYVETLKLIFLWAVVITVAINVLFSIGTFSGDVSILQAIIDSFVDMLVDVFFTITQVIIWVTIIFVIVERVGLSKNDLPLTKNGTSWTPEDLKNVQIIPQQKVIPIGEIIFSLFWTVIWAIVYWNADKLVGIYSNNGDGLQFIMPIFNQDMLISFWPLVAIFIALEVGLALYKWKIGQWTINVAVLNGIIHILSVVAFIVIGRKPELYNEAIIPYFAERMDVTTSSVSSTIQNIWWIVIISVAVSVSFEIITSFKKAKI